MSWFGNVVKGVEGLPIVGTGVAGAAALGDLAQGKTKQAASNAWNTIPGVADVRDVGTLYGALKSGATNPGADVSQADSLVKGLSYSQEQDPNQQLLTQLSGLLSKMTPAQANSLLTSGALKGTSLASELQSALGGESIPDVISAHQQAVDPTAYANQQNAQFTDLAQQILGGVYQNAMIPFMNQLNKGASQEVGTDVSQMEQALKGASPQEQQAMAGIPQELLATQNLVTQAGNQATATAPAYANLVQTLGNLMNQYKATQGAVSQAPYLETLLSTGTLPSAIGSTTVNPQSGLISPPSIP